MSVTNTTVDSWPSLRAAFPGLEGKHYFNFGGQGILPQLSLTAILEAYSFLEAEGPFSIVGNRWFQNQLSQLRQSLAQELNVAIGTLTITDNVTAGCNIVLWGMDWQAGDHILLTDCEHPGVIAIVQAIAARFGVTYSECPLLATLESGEPVAVIQDQLTPKTRLVVLSHLLWNTGQVLPLEAIAQACHDYPGHYPIQVLVDGAQSAGSLALNLSNSVVDYYAFTGHKWFCGPAGVGGLYIKPEHLPQLLPTYVGWRSLEYNAQGQVVGWKADGSRFEVATSAVPQYAGLHAAIAVHQQAGTSQERYQQICALSRYLWEGLQEIGGLTCLLPTYPEAGLVSFRLTEGKSPAQLVQKLEDSRFYLRTIVSPSCIRACCHYFTTKEEIEQLLELLRKLI